MKIPAVATLAAKSEMAISDADKLKVFNIASKTFQREKQVEKEIKQMTFCQTNRLLFVALEGGQIDIIDYDTLSVVKTFQHSGAAVSLAHSNDCRFFSIANEEGKVLTWDTSRASLDPLYTLAEDGSNVVEYSYEGTLLVTSGGDPTIRIWDARNAFKLAVLEWGGTSFVGGIKFGLSSDLFFAVDYSGSFIQSYPVNIDMLKQRLCETGNYFFKTPVCLPVTR